jgi:hypothetical protein
MSVCELVGRCLSQLFSLGDPDFSGRFEVQMMLAGVEASRYKQIELFNDWLRRLVPTPSSHLSESFWPPGEPIESRWMSIACITSFVALLRDGHGSVTLRAINPTLLADHALRPLKCLLGYVCCDMMARIGTVILNKLMGDDQTDTGHRIIAG